MQLKKIVNDIREPFSWMMVVGFYLIAGLINYAKPNLGVAFSLAGLTILLAYVVIGAAAMLPVMLVDKDKDGFAVFFKRYLPLAVVVQLAVSFMTPLSDWILSVLPF